MNMSSPRVVLPRTLDFHSRRGSGERFEIGSDLPIVGELAVGADFKSQKSAGRGNRAALSFLLGLRERGQHQNQDTGEKTPLFQHHQLLWKRKSVTVCTPQAVFASRRSHSIAGQFPLMALYGHVERHSTVIFRIWTVRKYQAW